MRSLRWDRSASIAAVHDRIWSYLSPASRLETLLSAAALLGWPEADALRLGELQFLLSAAVDDFLQQMPQLMRRLATASTREEQWTPERLHGPIAWNRTLALRGAVGSRHLYVTSPAKRVYQTPENEVLVHVLDAIVRTAQQSGWAETLARAGPATIVRDRLSEATRWQQSRLLSSIDRMPPTPRSVARIRSGRNRVRYAALLGAYDNLVSLVEQLNRQAVREAIEHAGLVTSSDPRLFELLVTFRLIDALQDHGWRMRPFALIEGHLHASGHRTDGRHIDLWYQSTPQELSTESRYQQVLASHAFTYPQPLRPDVILRWIDQYNRHRWLLVECKLSESQRVEHAARQALVDLLAYRRSFDAVLTGSGHPYGLGIAWGGDLHPVCEAEIALCTPDTLDEAVHRIIA